SGATFPKSLILFNGAISYVAACGARMRERAFPRPSQMPRTFPKISGSQRHDFISLHTALNLRHQDLGPSLKSLPLRFFQLALVVDTGDAGAESAYVVEHRFDHVRLDAHLPHMGGDTAAQIAQLPRSQNMAALDQCVIERCFTPNPRLRLSGWI